MSSLTTAVKTVLAIGCALGVDSSASAQLRAFVTSADSYTGSLGGLGGADATCQSIAETAGLSPGTETFVAWLSSSASDAWCRVQGLTGKRFAGMPCSGGTLTGAGPWARVGEPIVWSESLDQLTTAGPFQPLSIDQNGASVAGPSSGFAHTGTKLDGTLSAFGACGDWILTTGNAGVGITEATGSQWTDPFDDTCATPARLYCLEVGTGPPIPRPEFLPSGLVFVSETTDNGEVGGILQADQYCHAEAAAAHLPLANEFVALLSDVDVAAYTRLDAEAVFTRVDDYRVADNRDDLFDGHLRTTINILANGNRAPEGLPQGVPVWTGTFADGTPAGSNCNNWNNPFTFGDTGYANVASPAWVTGGDQPCSQFFRFYCFLNGPVLFWDGFERGSPARWSSDVP
jgi:hypothetical protein